MACICNVPWLRTEGDLNDISLLSEEGDPNDAVSYYINYKRCDYIY